MLEDILESVDFSFKWILIGFNFITILFLYIHQKNNKRPKTHSILFVTAHPDDQAMFFRPSLISLTADYHVHLLCLSGAGTEREQQLNNSCKILNISHVKCIKDDKLVDGLKEKWCEQTIRKYVLQYIRQHKIRALFSFDGEGVSYHANHKAIYYALKDLEVEVKEGEKKEVKDQKKENNKDEQNVQKQGKEMNKNQSQQKKEEEERKYIKIYYLESVMLLRKYSGLWEIPIALLKTFSWITISPIGAWNAMKSHASQFVWYRKLWVLCSRYQYINTFKRSFVAIDK